MRIRTTTFNDHKWRLTNNHEFRPLSAAAEMPFVLKSSLNNSPRIVHFAFSFESFNYLKYFKNYFTE